MRLRKAYGHLVEHVARLGPLQAARVLALKKRAAGADAVLHLPDLAGPLHVRTGTSDLAILDEVVLQRGYGFPLPKAPATIVDAGANIGMASLWLAKQYPHARIIAVEPDADNFRMLLRNTASLERITPVQAAIAPVDGHLFLDHSSGRGSSFRTRSEPTGSGQVRAVSMGTLMHEQGLDHIDLLKMDIEGAEKALFEGDCNWTERVHTLAIELHDRMEPGCGHAFFRSMTGTPRHYAVYGQLVIASREALRF
jgi:FkbM family methyltransferase